MVKNSTRGKLAIITGPSAGVGKDTLLRMFLAKHPDWRHPLSTTTRLPRSNERPNVDMNFVTEEQFVQLQQEDKFLESDFHAGSWYGTLKEPVVRLLEEGTHVLLRVDVNGALNIKKLLPEAITIMVLPENIDILKSRIQNRNTDSEEAIKERLELAKKEMAMQDKFDYCVVNVSGRPERALAEIEHIVLTD